MEDDDGPTAAAAAAPGQHGTASLAPCEDGLQSHEDWLQGFRSARQALRMRQAEEAAATAGEGEGEYDDEEEEEEEQRQAAAYEDGGDDDGAKAEQEEEEDAVAAGSQAMRMAVSRSGVHYRQGASLEEEGDDYELLRGEHSTSDNYLDDGIQEQHATAAAAIGATQSSAHEPRQQSLDLSASRASQASSLGMGRLHTEIRSLVDMLLVEVNGQQPEENQGGGAGVFTPYNTMNTTQRRRQQHQQEDAPTAATATARRIAAMGVSSPLSSSSSSSSSSSPVSSARASPVAPPVPHQQQHQIGLEEEEGAGYFAGGGGAGSGSGNYQYLLAMLREEKQAGRQQQRRIEELEHALAEVKQECEVSLASARLESHELRCMLRRVAAESTFADVFQLYEAHIARVEQEVQTLRDRNVQVELRRHATTTSTSNLLSLAPTLATKEPASLSEEDAGEPVYPPHLILPGAAAAAAAAAAVAAFGPPSPSPSRGSRMAGGGGRRRGGAGDLYHQQQMQLLQQQEAHAAAVAQLRKQARELQRQAQELRNENAELRRRERQALVQKRMVEATWARVQKVQAMAKGMESSLAASRLDAARAEARLQEAEAQVSALRRSEERLAADRDRALTELAVLHQQQHQQQHAQTHHYVPSPLSRGHRAAPR